MSRSGNTILLLEMLPVKATWGNENSELTNLRIYSQTIHLRKSEILNCVYVCVFISFYVSSQNIRFEPMCRTSLAFTFLGTDIARSSANNK
ncbi:hypothetical protein BRARA_I00115 [Brassica rapa]|uniref:Uncharacterized protein n=1 Tax=Brassica campestris TaxID=3711 RepID=A0A397XZL6_BRACM|nr:hypothetical protein BRARA_I00115 [Brassica rapa]